MAKLTPEQLMEVSERFLAYHLQMEGLAKSLGNDLDLLYPPFSGYHPEQEMLKRISDSLRENSQFMKSYSESLKQLSDMIADLTAGEEDARNARRCY